MLQPVVSPFRLQTSETTDGRKESSKNTFGAAARANFGTRRHQGPAGRGRRREGPAGRGLMRRRQNQPSRADQTAAARSAEPETVCTAPRRHAGAGPRPPARRKEEQVRSGHADLVDAARNLPPRPSLATRRPATGRAASNPQCRVDGELFRSKFAGFDGRVAVPSPLWMRACAQISPKADASRRNR